LTPALSYLQPNIQRLFRACYFCVNHSPRSGVIPLTPTHIILFPVSILRLIVSLLSLSIRSSFSSYFNIPHYVILLRRGGYKPHLDSDYRFPFLIRALSLTGTYSIAYHGSFRPFTNHPFSCHLSDLLLVSRLLVEALSLVNSRYSLIRKRVLTLAFSSCILSLALNRHDRVFYWDFNLQHSPLLLAAWLRDCLRVGSIHALHDQSTTPYCFVRHPLQHSISGTFLSLNDYKPLPSVSASIQLYSNRTHQDESLPVKSTSIVILEEHFSGTPTLSQLQLVYILQHSTDLVDNLYLKPRKDRAFSDSYLHFLRSYKLDVSFIDAQTLTFNPNIIALATKGSYPHDLALLGLKVILISTKPLPLRTRHQNPATVWSLSEFRYLLQGIHAAQLCLSDETLSYNSLRRHSSLMVFKSLNFL
jgi:hypothetical protein